MYIPIEDKAKIIQTTTPKLAKSIISKYVNIPADGVVRDLEENHGLKLTQSYIQNITYIVGRLGEKIEDEIEYSLPELKKEVVTVGIGMDGTCSFVGNSGWRETMVGTISLYDKEGNRLHTVYTSQAPEYGKERFKELMKKEIEDIKKTVSPLAKFVGIADGARDNWSFLAPFVDYEIVDFYHASEYVAKASRVVKSKEQKEWLNAACHALKNDEYSALAILEEMKLLEKRERIPQKTREDLESAITYFTNHHQQMNYSQAINNNIPIGSGVTESACKVIVKQRLSISGARWSHCGANNMLRLRAINSTDGRWEQFWGVLVG